jgi:hypothetical protein
MTHEQAAKVVAEWMGWGHPPMHLPDTMREIERKLAENLEWLNEYVGLLSGMSGEWQTSDWADYMKSTDEQRIQAAAQTIEAMKGAEHGRD